MTEDQWLSEAADRVRRLNAGGHEGIWGVMEMFSILIMEVVTQLYAFSKAQQMISTLQTGHTACELYLNRDDLK